MAISKKVCPICGKEPAKRGGWVTYHISYDPEITLDACKSCNFLEYLLRHHKSIKKYGYGHFGKRYENIKLLKNIGKNIKKNN